MPLQSQEKAGKRTSPNYTRVREWLLNYIADQNLVVGDRIPSERMLAKHLGFSRPTIARAVSELVDQGILTREQGNGTFVSTNSSPTKTLTTATIGMLMPFIREEASGEISGEVTTSKLTELFRRENVSSDIIHGVLSVLKKRSCRLVVQNMSTSQEEEAVLENLPNQAIDGAVVMPIARRTSLIYSKLADQGLPFVFVDRYIPDMPIDRVVSDNFKGAKEGMSYLLGRGHRRIAYFTHFLELTSAMDREAGYRSALDDAGIPFDPEIVCGPHIARHHRLSFEYALRHCLSLPDPITAVFGMNDDMVWAAIQAANKLGLSIPDDLEVAGFFDTTLPRGIPANFTRIVQARYKIGQIAAEMLVERIEGKAPTEARHILVAPELIPASLD